MTSLKQLYIYYESELPEEGWFQCCIMCDCVTGGFNYYKNITLHSEDDVEIYPYLCNKCKKKLLNDMFFKKYEITCEELISENLKIIDPSNQTLLPPV